MAELERQGLAVTLFKFALLPKQVDSYDETWANCNLEW